MAKLSDLDSTGIQPRRAEQPAFSSLPLKDIKPTTSPTIKYATKPAESPAVALPLKHLLEKTVESGAESSAEFPPASSRDNASAFRNVMTAGISKPSKRAKQKRSTANKEQAEQAPPLETKPSRKHDIEPPSRDTSKNAIQPKTETKHVGSYGDNGFRIDFYVSTTVAGMAASTGRSQPLYHSCRVAPEPTAPTDEELDKALQEEDGLSFGEEITLADGRKGCKVGYDGPALHGKRMGKWTREFQEMCEEELLDAEGGIWDTTVSGTQVPRHLLPRVSRYQ